MTPRSLQELVREGHLRHIDPEAGDWNLAVRTQPYGTIFLTPVLWYETHIVVVLNCQMTAAETDDLIRHTKMTEPDTGGNFLARIEAADCGEFYTDEDVAGIEAIEYVDQQLLSYAR